MRCLPVEDLKPGDYPVEERLIENLKQAGIKMNALIAVIMGSRSDWETMGHAAKTLDQLHIPYEVKIVSAHRTPDFSFNLLSLPQERGIEVIIAGAGGAAHLPGMTAAKTHLPVLGVPVNRRHSMAWIRSSRSCRCRQVFLLARLPSGAPGQSTRHCWRRPLLRTSMKNIGKRCWLIVPSKRNRAG